MTVDLIQMIARQNNLHDVDTWMIFKWVFKSAAAILIVTNTWNIVMGVFDMAQSVVAQAAGIIGSDASIDISLSYDRFGVETDGNGSGTAVRAVVPVPLYRHYHVGVVYRVSLSSFMAV